MTSAFVDTSYLLALELANDQNHAAAMRHWQRVGTALPRLVTTSYVFDEVVTFFNCRGHHAKAAEVGNTLLASASVQMVYVDESLFRDGWNYLLKHHDKDYSLTDCISFLVMQRVGASTAYTFDHCCPR
jgi:predicted nucleic acid-binding protein